LHCILCEHVLMSRTASAMSWTAEHTYSLPPTKMPHSALEPGNPHTPNRYFFCSSSTPMAPWNTRCRHPRDENHNPDETLAAPSTTISFRGHAEPHQALYRCADAPSSIRPWNYQKQDLARSWNWTEETRTDPQVASQMSPSASSSVSSLSSSSVTSFARMFCFCMH
jgi:hypothetical protein